MTALKRVVAAMSLLMVSAICSCGTEAPTRLASSASSTTTTTTSTTTTTTPPAVTVASIVDGRTVILSNGTTVLISGLAQPGACWAASSVEFATKTLVGKAVEVVGTQVLLAGQNYAVLAAGKGVARAVAGADAAVALAETTAKQASLGFWGPSCGGLDVKAAPQPVAPQPVAPQPVAPQPVAPQPQPQSQPAPPAAAYYANCAAAKAAGAAPLHRGDPGYRSGLDRDNDGVACE